MDAFVTIFREEGIFAFAKGLSMLNNSIDQYFFSSDARLLYVVPAAAFSFVFYEKIAHAFHNAQTHLDTLS